MIVFAYNFTSSKSIFLTNFVTSRSLKQFLTSWIELEKSAKICLAWWLLLGTFYWGPNLVMELFQVWPGTLLRKIRCFSAEICF